MSKLILVPTPIGNLGDITLRALTVLQEVDLILAEDTRKASILLSHYNISKAVISYHNFNEHKNVAGIVQKIENGSSVALITDAGTPGISDPGFLLVRECLRNNIEVECLPGATALIPALVISGLPCEAFLFQGFLPVKKGLSSLLASLSTETRTIVFYESPHRISKTLDKLCEYLGEDRQASVSRELTKIYEETYRGSLKELSDIFKSKKFKGEMVIVVSGMSKKTNS